MPELSDAARRILAKQKARYLAGLGAKVEELEAVRDDPMALADVAHKIAGSSGLHGLTPIRACAVAVEESVKAGDDATAIGQRLDALIAVLREAETPAG